MRESGWTAILGSNVREHGEWRRWIAWGYMIVAMDRVTCRTRNRHRQSRTFALWCFVALQTVTRMSPGERNPPLVYMLYTYMRHTSDSKVRRQLTEAIIMKMVKGQCWLIVVDGDGDGGVHDIIFIDRISQRVLCCSRCIRLQHCYTPDHELLHPLLWSSA